VKGAAVEVEGSGAVRLKRPPSAGKPSKATAKPGSPEDAQARPGTSRRSRSRTPAAVPPGSPDKAAPATQNNRKRRASDATAAASPDIRTAGKETQVAVVQPEASQLAAKSPVNADGRTDRAPSKRGRRSCKPQAAQALKAPPAETLAADKRARALPSSARPQSAPRTKPKTATAAGSRPHSPESSPADANGAPHEAAPLHTVVPPPYTHVPGEGSSGGSGGCGSVAVWESPAPPKCTAPPRGSGLALLPVTSSVRNEGVSSTAVAAAASKRPGAASSASSEVLRRDPNTAAIMRNPLAAITSEVLEAARAGRTGSSVSWGVRLAAAAAERCALLLFAYSSLFGFLLPRGLLLLVCLAPLGVGEPRTRSPRATARLCQ
jgi:hypothetical protein